MSLVDKMADVDWSERDIEQGIAEIIEAKLRENPLLLWKIIRRLLNKRTPTAGENATVDAVCAFLDNMEAKIAASKQDMNLLRNTWRYEAAVARLADPNNGMTPAEEAALQAQVDGAPLAVKNLAAARAAARTPEPTPSPAPPQKKLSARRRGASGRAGIAA